MSGSFGRGEPDAVTLTVDRLITKTDAAVLLEIDGEEVWIPKSLVVDEDYDGGSVEVERWFAEKEGLVE